MEADIDNLYTYIQEQSVNLFFQHMENCKHTQENSGHHPEESVLSHLLQVADIAFKESYDLDLILAAMLHDIGKALSARDHPEHSLALLEGHISNKTEWLIANHMRMLYLLDGRTKKLKKIYTLLESPWITDLILLARWDKMGRVAGLGLEFDRDAIEKSLLKACKDHFCVQTKFGVKDKSWEHVHKQTEG